MTDWLVLENIRIQNDLVQQQLEVLDAILVLLRKINDRLEQND